MSGVCLSFLKFTYSNVLSDVHVGGCGCDVEFEVGDVGIVFWVEDVG